MPEIYHCTGRPRHRNTKTLYQAMGIDLFALLELPTVLLRRLLIKGLFNQLQPLQQGFF